MARSIIVTGSRLGRITATSIVCGAGSFTTLAASDLFTQTRSGLGATPPAYGATTSVSALLTNSTAAGDGTDGTSTVQIAPAIRWHGSAWKSNATAAAQNHEWQAFVLPATGAASTSSTWKLQSSNNAGAFTDRLTVDSAGVVQVPGSINSTSGFNLNNSSPVAITSATHGMAFNADGNSNTVVIDRDNGLTVNSGLRLGFTSTYFTRSSAGVFAGPSLTLSGTLAVTGKSTVTGLATGLATKTTDYTATSTDHKILVDTRTGPISITLPTAVSISGTEYLIKDKFGSAATNPITILTTSGQTIDGAASYVIGNNYQSITVVSDGANWYIL